MHKWINCSGLGMLGILSNHFFIDVEPSDIGTIKKYSHLFVLLEKILGRNSWFS